jgi:hypothetical protein
MDWDYDSDTCTMIGEPEENVYMASFDIGYRHLAYYVELVNIEAALSIRNIPKSRRYRDDGATTDEFQRILDALAGTGTIVELDCVDISDNTDNSGALDHQTLHNLTEFMDSKCELFSKCTVFVIEEQFRSMFGRGRAKVGAQNTKAIRIQHHLESYIYLSYPEAVVKPFPARNKTQIIGCPKARNTDSKRKTWAVHAFRDMLITLENFDMLKFLEDFPRKRDDISDVFLQLLAFKYLAIIDGRI